MIIKQFIEPPIENNNYIIIDEASKKAALIDCSYNDSKITDYIKEQGAELEYILLTHGHFDHIMGINEFKNSLGYNSPVPKVLLHEDDLNQVKLANQYISLFGLSKFSIPKVDDFIKDGDFITLGNIKIKVVHTPGHTQGGVCYLVENNLFSGDTIFKESVGRCDLEGGDFVQLTESIEKKIFTLPDNTNIYPGHGKTTTVSWEKTHNNFM